MKAIPIVVAGALCAWGFLSCQVVRAEAVLELRAGDHVAVVGSGLADRQQHHGWLETLIHGAWPDHDLTIRNFGFAADEINVRPRSADVPSTEWFLSMRKGDSTPGNPEIVYKAGTDFGADVILAYWGFNESFRGEEGLPGFKEELARYLDGQLAARYNGESAPRVVLFSPIAHEVVEHPDFPDAAENNARLALYSRAMGEVAREKGVPFVDLFTASSQLFDGEEARLTINGIHLTEEGDRRLAPIQFQALFGREAPALDAGRLAAIRAAVLEKNTEWHHRYRTVDQFNIYGGRSRISYEGVTNAVTMGEEMAQRDVKTANRDRLVWARAKGGDLVVKDDNLPPVHLVPPNRKDPVPYLDGEEAIRHLKLAPGCKVELVACEKSFPELVNPVQMNFDTRGRLWIAAWPNYPATSPTTEVFDKLLVFDLDPRTGKAVKCTTFADGLNCPTGFQFYKDGVLVMQSPDLWYLRDTDGDGKADWKERVLHGLDAADSHHETNSMCLEPGGAVYLSDGVFHRTGVETAGGPVRNTDGAIYRYEPKTGKFMRHVPYGFANPHGRVFDHWGNDLITDATGNANYFGPAMSGHLDAGSHGGMKEFWARPSRPCAGTAILSSRHFPDDWQGNFLNANVIGIQGVFRAGLSDEGSGIKGETLEHLITTDIAGNPNFRPSGITVAPDGSLYLMDWSQMLIGHLQHHLRDPYRDHGHGRLYRITYEGRPLLTPKKIHDEPVAALLELLKEPEIDVRMRAKIELGRHDSAEVVKGVTQWLNLLDETDPAHEHRVLEALWVHQWHNVVDLDLLGRVLKSPEPRARAQAVRVMGYWRDRVPDALERLKAAALDESPRVRLEAVRVASFFRDWRAADAALAALRQPMDYYLDYCLGETMRQLEPWWKKAITDGESIAADNPAGIRYVLGSVNSADLAKLPKSKVTLTALLTRPDVPAVRRQAALADLAALDGVPAIQALCGILASDAGEGAAAEDLCRFLLQQPVADFKAARAGIEALTVDSRPALVRQSALAAVMMAEGSVDAAWSKAIAKPGALMDFLSALPLVPDAALRGSAFERVFPLLERFPDAVESSLDGGAAGEARYVRIELPRSGTLTLAEVEILAGTSQVGRGGRARQSSTAHGGEAQRALDGDANPDFTSNTQTHTNEGENGPWWEADLGAGHAVSEIVVWNRAGFEDRLEGFSLIVTDSQRREIFRQEGIPAPRLSSRFAIPNDPSAALRTAAIRALAAAGREPGRVFAGLAKVIARGEVVPAAAAAMSRIPAAARDRALADPTVAALFQWASAVPVEGRTTQGFSEVLKTANELTALMPEARAAVARQRLMGLRVSVFVIRAVREELRFDTKRLVVEAGKPFQIILENPDLMPHNLLVVQPGASQAVAEAVQAQAPDVFDRAGRAYVPDGDPRVIAATKLLEAGQSETLQVTAPSTEGEYEFVCTFPGHWSVMRGKLVVTRDVEAYLKAHPEGD